VCTALLLLPSGEYAGEPFDDGDPLAPPDTYDYIGYYVMCVETEAGGDQQLQGQGSLARWQEVQGEGTNDAVDKRRSHATDVANCWLQGALRRG
jgi:hypothetical protein